MAKYRLVGTHPVEVVKGDKAVMLAPGEFIELSAEDMKHPDNANLKDDLIEVKGGSK